MRGRPGPGAGSRAARRRGPLVGSRATQAYVLRTWDFSEADRIVVLVSSEHGRIDGLLRRARRVPSRYGAALEPLSEVRVRYREREGKDLVSLVELELLRSSFDLITGPEALDLVHHLAELSLTVARPGEANATLVRLLDAVLGAGRALGVADRVADRVAEAAGTASGARVLGLLRLYFDVWVARLEGFWPDLGSCAACGAELRGSRSVDLGSEGARCARCRLSSRGASVALSDGAAGLARSILRSPPDRLAAEPVEGRAAGELLRLAEGLLTVHLEKRLRTLSR